MDPSRDMGGDGLSGTTNQFVAKDAYGFNLNYYTGDYSAINSGVLPFPGYMAYLPAGAYRPLYNGNISSMAETVDTFKTSPTLMFNYTYDQLNRLTGMDVFNNFNAGTNSWSGMVSIPQYKERIAYDPNGNILKDLRNSSNSGSTIGMDSLNYQYFAGTNRLQRIRDNVPATQAANYDDLDDQPQDNYAYDETGNLTKDSSEGLYAIKWSVYGKPLEISRVPVTGSTLQKISYSYDAAGNRIGKVLEYSSTSTKYYTWYGRDAQGNLLCIYTANGVSPVSMPINGNKWLVYGSSRLGTFNYQVGLNGGTGRLIWIDFHFNGILTS